MAVSSEASSLESSSRFGTFIVPSADQLGLARSSSDSKAQANMAYTVNTCFMNRILAAVPPLFVCLVEEYCFFLPVSMTDNGLAPTAQVMLCRLMCGLHIGKHDTVGMDSLCIAGCSSPGQCTWHGLLFVAC